MYRPCVHVYVYVCVGFFPLQKIYYEKKIKTETEEKKVNKNYGARDVYHMLRRPTRS